MIVDERIITFINSLDTKNSEILEDIEREALADNVPIIRRAMDVLKTLEGPYDFIFMDAAKGQYIHYLPEILRLLAKGGILVSDNVMQDGDVIESRFAVERRDRTIHARMREYLYELKHNDALVTSIIPLGDGVALSVKKEVGTDIAQ